MPSLRFLNVYLYHHARSSWNDLSLPQLAKTACLSLINEHINLDSLAQAAPRLIYFRLQIEPYPDDIKTTNDHTQWAHVHRGLFSIFHDKHVHKFVRLVCLPLNSLLREGIQAESTSKTHIIPCPLDLPIDSNKEILTNYFISLKIIFRFSLCLVS
ncbi:unnamed protein product [Rotaria socialis]|nr:unnamed protein product [Rotaria socialis]